MRETLHPAGKSAIIGQTDENGGSSSEIGKDAITVSTYWVYMSTKRLSENELVEYEVIAGDGLTAGTDFYLVPNTASPLVFLPGVYEMPIRIEWRKSTDFDPNKDNTVRIVLTGTSSNFTLGYPGPAQRNKEYVITKK